LDACLADASEDVRCAALEALFVQPLPDVVKPIEPALADASERVRRTALELVARVPSAHVTRLLLERMENDPSVRDDAALLLAKLGDADVAQRVLALVAREPEERRLFLVDLLADVREPAAEPMVVALLADASPIVRRAAVRALARFATGVAQRHLLAAARDDDAGVRRVVAEVMPTHDAAAVSALARLCVDVDPDVARVAREREATVLK
jgi:HEAT repeat protein